VHGNPGRAQAVGKMTFSEQTHDLDVKTRPIQSRQQVQQTAAGAAVECIDDLNDARQPALLGRTSTAGVRTFSQFARATEGIL
jgi:hypothetical protein